MPEIEKYDKNANFSEEMDQNIHPFGEKYGKNPILLSVKLCYQILKGLKMY